MEFGIAYIPSGDYSKDLSLAKSAESLGFDYAWIPDQTFYPDPYVVMTLMALETDRINIGLGVTNPYTRHPSMSARAIASVGLIAPGRIHLGIGAGNRKELILPLGMDGSHAGRKCREMVEIVRGLLLGQKVEYFGDHYQVAGIKMEFITLPDIPIYIAGRGAKVLQAAGEVADGVIIGALCTPAGIQYALEQVAIGANVVGRTASDLYTISWVTCQITENREEAIEQIKPTVAHILGGAPSDLLEKIGLPMDRIKNLKDIYFQDGIAQAAKLVTSDFIDAVTIVGDAEEVGERIKQLESLGVNQFVALIYSGNYEQKMAIMQGFADDVLSSFTSTNV